MAKKICTILSIILLAISLTTSLISTNAYSIKTEENNNLEQIQKIYSLDCKKWTWLFYDDSDAKDLEDVFQWFAEEVCSGDNLNVIVLQDTIDGPVKLWKIDEHHNEILLKVMGELNMGSFRTLRDFIKYGKENFPAERYMLSINDHGHGWKGACVDDTNMDDIITMNGFQRALRATGGVDIIEFITPCLMACIEGAYELRNYVDIYIGSEEIDYKQIYWGEVMNNICNMLNNETYLSNIEIGGKIIQSIKVNSVVNDPYWRNIITMSAIRTDKIINLTKAINILSKDLIKNLFKTYSKIKLAHEQTFKFGLNYHEFFDEYDLYDFTQNLLSIDGIDPIIQNDLRNVQEAINQTVVAEYHGINRTNANGLSIFLPDNKEILYSNPLVYKTRLYGLDFCRDTFWDEFILFYLFTNIFSN